MGRAVPGLVALSSISRQAEQAMGSIPPWRLLQFLRKVPALISLNGL